MAKTGIIHLAKNIKMDKNYKSVLGYTEAQMINLITDTNNIVYSATDYSFIRDRGTIKINCKYENAVQCNYMAFQNKDYSLKWFFAFVDEVKYLSENSCVIVYTVDIWTTWWEYWSPKACFVVREHVIDDTIGTNTVPEDVELGEYIIDSSIPGRSFTELSSIIVGATIDLDDEAHNFPDVDGTTVGGVYSGLKYYQFYSVASLNYILKKVASKGKSDAIVSIFMGVNSFFDSTPCANIAANLAYDNPNSTSLLKTLTWTVAGTYPILPPTKATTLNSYTPVNKKLLTFPYCYLMASNNNGSNAIYKYELFAYEEHGYCDFRFIGTLTPGMSIRLQPLNYNNQTANNEEGLNVGKLPVCSWNTDVYTNWLTQNGVNIGLSVASSLFSIVGGAALASTGAGSLAGAGSIVSGAMGIAHSIGQVYQHSLTPPQAEGNINNGDIMWTSGNSGITMYKMSIKSEFASIIDKYFTRCGYKVNKIKVPNMGRRTNYNYVQIAAEENVAYPNNHNNLGIPAPALDKINELFRSGITIWNNHANFGDYSVTNTITNP